MAQQTPMIATVIKWEGVYGFVEIDGVRFFIHKSAVDNGTTMCKLYPLQRLSVSEIDSNGNRPKVLKAKTYEYPLDTGTGLVCLGCNKYLGLRGPAQGQTHRCPACDRLLIVTNGRKP